MTKRLFVGHMVSHDLRYLQLQVNPDQATMLSGSGLLENFTLVELVSILSTYEEASEYILSLRYTNEESMQWLENDESFEITGIIEQVPGYSLISVKAHGTIAMLIHNNLGIWVQTPTIISNVNGLFMTIQGTTKGLKRFRDEIGNILPPSIKIRISKDLKADWIAAPQLPTRRKEVMELAVKLGYYSTPRKCTQRELADALGVRQGTIAEHLQSAEGVIIQSWADQAQ
jgi:hypothetical protein